MKIKYGPNEIGIKPNAKLAILCRSTVSVNCSKRANTIKREILESKWIVIWLTKYLSSFLLFVCCCTNYTKFKINHLGIEYILFALWWITVKAQRKGYLNVTLPFILWQDDNLYTRINKQKKNKFIWMFSWNWLNSILLVWLYFSVSYFFVVVVVIIATACSHCRLLNKLSIKDKCFYIKSLYVCYFLGIKEM